MQCFTTRLHIPDLFDVSQNVTDPAEPPEDSFEPGLLRLGSSTVAVEVRGWGFTFLLTSWLSRRAALQYCKQRRENSPKPEGFMHLTEHWQDVSKVWPQARVSLPTPARTNTP